METWTAQRAKVAALSRRRDSDDTDLLEAKRDYRAIRLTEYAAKIVAQAPPLTREQTDRIVAILRGGVR